MIRPEVKQREVINRLVAALKKVGSPKTEEEEHGQRTQTFGRTGEGSAAAGSYVAGRGAERTPGS